MPQLLFGIVGAAIILTLAALLIGLAFQTRDPANRAVIAVSLAWVACSIVAASVIAIRGGPIRLETGAWFFPGAIMAFYFLEHRYRKGRRSHEPSERESR